MHNLTLWSASLTNSEYMNWSKMEKRAKCFDIFNLLKNVQSDFIIVVFVSEYHTQKKNQKQNNKTGNSFPWMRLPYLLLFHVHRKWQWNFLWNRQGMGEVQIYWTGLCASKWHYSALKVFFFFFPFKIYNIFLDFFFLCMMFQIPFKMTHCITNGWHFKPTWHFHIYTNGRNVQDVVAYNRDI